MKETNLITPEILEQIDKVNKNCHDLHLPSPPVTFIKLEIIDENGDVAEEIKTKSNSWVRNAYNVLAQNFLPCNASAGAATFGAGSQAIKDTAGTTNGYTYATTPYSGSLAYVAFNGSANNTFGIVVGTSDTAESFEHNALQAIVAHGTGSGQLSYAAMTEPIAAYTSGTKKWTQTITRNLSNGSGASITIKELGLIFKMNQTSTVPYVLMSRDVLATPVAVADGQTLRVTYTTEITYPS